jgi:1,4-dihydroxy-2-naphthoyl-CoA hydrolase
MKTPIWTKEFTIEDLNAFSEGCLVSHLGIEFTESGDDYLKATLPVNENTRQPMGLLHGGASVVLAETLANTAAHLCLDDGYYSVGIEINANHVRSVKSGLVTGTTRPVQIGRKIHVWETVITDEEGRTVSTGRMTVAVLQKG